MHFGADNPEASAIGAIGCIIPVGSGAWSRLNTTIKNLSGSSDPQVIGDSGNLKMHIQATAKPDLPEIKRQ